ncbi:MAG: hypothetical protein AB7J63_04500 [Vicinamibacterales bacterium]
MAHGFEHHHGHQISAFPSDHPAEHRLLAALASGLPLRAIEPTRARRTRPTFRTLNFLSFENRRASRLAPIYFALFVAAQLGALLVFIRATFRPTWERHLDSGIGAMAATYLACSLVLCFGEYFFHRYLLHLETVRFLRTVCSSHLTHHKLTAIRFDSDGRVRSAYPITDAAHDDQSTFPSWALLPFFAFFTPFFAPMAFSFPDVPILISGYSAIATAHFLYEVIHALHHAGYEAFWQPRLARRASGRVWRWLYGFHLAHHANYRCNLNVAGFFGIPLADLAFGTYKQPSPLLVDGAHATAAAARALSPEPRWPIAWLDRVAFKRRRWMVRRP